MLSSRPRNRAIVAAIAVTGIALTAAPAHAATYTVLNRSDSGAGSLRQAILDANATVAVPDDIQFGIPGAGAIPHVIRLATDLPTITDTIDIRGYSQPGAVRAVAGTPALVKIVLDAGDAANGLVVESNDSAVRGLVIHTAGSVSGDGVGLRIEGDRNRLEGSYVGLDGWMNTIFTHGNAGDGVHVEGNNNVIGGTAAGDRNVISANGKLAGTDADGVSIDGNDNLVRGNAIGTDPEMVNGQIGNSEAGVRLEGDRNLVGGYAAGAGNVISGNGTGVVVASGDDNDIEGNLIGTDGDGEAAVGNGQGVIVESPDTAIGGSIEGKGNVISASLSGPGVELLSDDNTVRGNKIGTDADGEQALPNFTGIRITGDDNTVGGASDLAGNLVSGNHFDGITVQRPAGFDPQPAGNRVKGNLIGTDADGTDPLPNEDDGVAITDGTANTIGGLNPEAEGNIIAFNGDAASGDGDGVNVHTGGGNSVLGNSIHSNAALGIDLNLDGVTVNDPSDTDAGANALQNFPEIGSATVTAAGDTTVTWSLDARSLTLHRIEFFATGSDCDDSGHGQGQTFLGSTSVWTDVSGDAEGETVMTTPAAAGENITATATVEVTSQPAPGGPVGGINNPVPPPFPPLNGPAQTSEFSSCVPVS